MKEFEKEELFAVDFADWINNNWFIPIKEGLWRIEIENEEYTLEIPKVNIFSTHDLMVKFKYSLNLIEINKSADIKILEYLKDKLSKKDKESVIIDLRVMMSYKTKNYNFYNRCISYLETPQD